MAQGKDTFIVQLTVEFDGLTDTEQAHNALFKAVSAAGVLPEGCHLRGTGAWRMFHEDKAVGDSRPQRSTF